MTFTDIDELDKRAYRRSRDEQKREQIWFQMFDRHCEPFCKGPAKSISHENEFMIEAALDAYLGIKQ